MNRSINLPIEHRAPILEALREYILIHTGNTGNLVLEASEALRFLNGAPVQYSETIRVDQPIEFLTRIEVK